MWENERKKTIIRNVIIFVLLIAAAVGLLMGLKTVNDRITLEDELLSAEHSSQRQEQNELRQENLAAVQLAYEQDLAALETYLPGIVCWGDSLTAGSSGNVSYPLTLQKYINTYLCDIYDLRYSVENPESYSRLKWDDYKVSIPVVNMGVGQESSATILGRSGAVPYITKADFMIPAGKEPVSVAIVSENGKEVAPLVAENTGINPVTIAGVEGTLTRTAKAQGYPRSYYQFTRLEEGMETEVAKGTEVVTACKESYQDYIHIVWIGTYGEYRNPETLVNETKALLERQQVNNDRYLVIGPCSIRGNWVTKKTETLDSIDSAMFQAFGNRYVNLRKYLVEDGLRDAGLSKSKLDTTYITESIVPDSFRSNAEGADLNGVAYELLGKLIYERMEILGYFEEIREELNLDKITQDILKDNPTYFEKMLK